MGATRLSWWIAGPASLQDIDGCKSLYTLAIDGRTTAFLAGRCSAISDLKSGIAISFRILIMEKLYMYLLLVEFLQHPQTLICNLGTIKYFPPQDEDSSGSQRCTLCCSSICSTAGLPAMLVYYFVFVTSLTFSRWWYWLVRWNKLCLRNYLHCS
jgi:hypothetical protein